MSFERNLVHKATYWFSTGTDKYGKSTFGTPVVLDCRWENKAVTVQNKMGEETTSKSVVYFATELDVDGYLYLGELSDADPTTVENAHEIQAVGILSDLRNMRRLTVAYL